MSFDPNLLIIRPGTSDEGTWHDVFDEDKAYHRPPPSVKDPKFILDLGAYVGYTSIDLAYLFPHAHVWAYEPCFENFTTLFSNVVTSKANNIDISSFAIGSMSGWGEMVGSHHNIKKIVMDKEGSVPVTTMNQVVKYRADYVKMDLEGAEKEILKDGFAWADRVGCIKVELHDDYSVVEAMQDLTNLGFVAEADTNHPCCVIGQR